MAFAAYSAPAPVEHPAVTRQRLRQKLTKVIDKLLTALDAIDGDPDLEDTDEDEQCDDEGAPNTDLEPALGWTESASLSGVIGYGSEDTEPSLGALEAIDQRRGWGDHRDDPNLWYLTDAEDQCDDEGAADPDLEPSLGSLGDNGRTAQTSWAAGDRRASDEEREQVCEREPDEDFEAFQGEACPWPDEGDQTRFRA